MRHGQLFTSMQGIRFARFLLRKRHCSMEYINQQCLSSNWTYEVAVEKLNTLQSNACVLERARLQKDRQATYNVPFTEKYLSRVGITLDVLDNQLKVIHVSGTKGKGSTCAFCESILKYHGLKTGFYSSPHLVEVRERIRINGKPLSKELFAKYFWQVFTNLSNQKDNEADMPAYFKFLTIMAFYVFLKEKVDVAIIEVGIGGLYDCTNVIRKPCVVGISSLGLDHVSLLGNTVEEIAAHKAGIMKSGVPTFTLADQPGATLQLLNQKALAVKCPLYTVPPLEEYQWNQYKMTLGLSGKVQLKNASLALQLSHAFLHPSNIKQTNFPLMASPFQILTPDALGLALTTWPGRSQILKHKGTSYYIDGAHTPESIEACIEWFKQASHPSDETNMSHQIVKKVLIFNTTGDRNSHRILLPLRKCQFDVAIFCPNIVSATDSSLKDQVNKMVTVEQQLDRCEWNKKVWLENADSDHSADEFQHSQMVLSLPTINMALQQVQHLASTIDKVDVLVTGSLHLVGGVLSVLDPNLSFLETEKQTG